MLQKTFLFEILAKTIICVFKNHFETAFRERVQWINSLRTNNKREYGIRQTKCLKVDLREDHNLYGGGNVNNA